MIAPVAVHCFYYYFETLKFAHRLISEGAGMVTRDEKSEYDHVKLQEQSQTMYNAKSNNAIGCRGKQATFMSR